MSAAATFATVLGAEHNAWLALIDLLEKEENALVLGDAEILTTLNVPKLQLLNEISAHVKARNAFLAANQLSPDHKGMEKWMAKNSAANTDSLWMELRDCETRARHLNERVGILLNMRMNTTRQALNTLLTSAKDQAGGYDSEGMTLSPSGSRPLTSV